MSKSKSPPGRGPSDRMIAVRQADLAPFLPVLFRAMKTEARKSAVIRLSLVGNDRVPRGALRKFSVRNFKRRVKALMKKAGVEFGYLAIDISWNEDESGLYEPHWSVHAYGLVVGPTLRGLRASLKRLCPRSQTTPRPYDAVEWDGSIDSVSYSLKFEFDRRVGYVGYRRDDPFRKMRNVRKRDMRVEHLPELDAFLERIGPYGRVIPIGAQLRRGPNGPSFVDLRPSADDDTTRPIGPIEAT